MISGGKGPGSWPEAHAAPNRVHHRDTEGTEKKGIFLTAKITQIAKVEGSRQGELGGSSEPRACGFNPDLIYFDLA
ncbi:hypothetical protein SBV1_2430001 [Verrucomicrobia bacterium]|nr:hypothetical protein SBV1_2430001 [Verrucomicrobiota bacterium]